MKLVVINGHFDDLRLFVHKADCADVAKFIVGHDYSFEEFDTKRALWLDSNADVLPVGGPAWNVNFCLCTKDLPDGGTYNTPTDEDA